MKPEYAYNNLKQINGFDLPNGDKFFKLEIQKLGLYRDLERHNVAARNFIERGANYIYLDAARIYVEPTYFLGYLCVSLEHKILSQYGVEWRNIIHETLYIQKVVEPELTEALFEFHDDSVPINLELMQAELKDFFSMVWAEQLYLWFPV